MTYTKLTFNIKSEDKPYLFIGSKMRGILGYALKDEVCINPMMKCEGCFALKECIFYKMYEEQNRQHEYRLDFKLYDERYKFSLFLFGSLRKEKEVLHKAMLKSLDEYQKIKSKTLEKKLKLKKGTSVVKVTFETPLRMKKENRFNSKNIEFNDILMTIERRYRELQGLQRVMSKPFENFKVVSKHFRYKDLTRKSNKQKNFMNMGGLMGEIVVSDLGEKEYELLKIGEIIGVGKATVFGLGKIKVEEIV